MGYLERGASPLQAHHGALVLAERGRRGRVGMRRHWGEADLQEVTAECGIIHSLGPAVELLQPSEELLQPVQAVGCQVFQADYEGRTAINAFLLMQLSRVQCQGLTQKGYLPPGFPAWGALLGADSEQALGCLMLWLSESSCDRCETVHDRQGFRTFRWKMVLICSNSSTFTCRLFFINVSHVVSWASKHSFVSVILFAASWHLFKM